MNISSYVHVYTVQSFQNIHVSSRCVDFRGINRIYGYIDSVYHNKLHDRQQFFLKIVMFFAFRGLTGKLFFAKMCVAHEIQNYPT